MIVSQILKAKKHEGVYTAAPTATISEAAEILSSHGIGALVVTTDGTHVHGIVSERDVVRELGRKGAACLENPISTIMTTRVTTCKHDEQAVTILATMTAGHFRHMPVCEDGVMVGFISIGDVVKGRLSELAMENDAMSGFIKGY